MTWGPGKYDDICTMVREEVGLVGKGGGVLLIVVGGPDGGGFSCQADVETMLGLPDLLEYLAQKIRSDGIG